MHLAHLRLRDFRNYRRLEMDFAPGFHVLIGDNAQGKTNLLEAIYLIATLRSFRGVGGAQMVREGQKGYFIGSQIVSQIAHETKMFWSPRERNLSLDQKVVRRISDYLGCFRAVVFATEDLQLVKGAPRIRRRFMDLLLTQTEPRYLSQLQRYARTLRSRNAVLRRPVVDELVLEGFSKDLVSVGNQIVALRQKLVPRLSALARLAHRRISHDAEELIIRYRPNVRADFQMELNQARSRERNYRSTIVGPHRDELELLLDDKPAAQFGSEGQKRTLAIALKMAQAEFVSGIHGVPPVLLFDDVMGELDERRRSGLIPLINLAGNARGQVFMTCTEENWPQELGAELTRWRVKAGALERAS